MLFALQIFVGKHQLTPRLAHVPFDIVGEHAQEDVCAHAALQMMMDRADMQIDGFHRTERALDFGECFVTAHRLR